MPIFLLKQHCGDKNLVITIFVTAILFDEIRKNKKWFRFVVEVQILNAKIQTDHKFVVSTVSVGFVIR